MLKNICKFTLVVCISSLTPNLLFAQNTWVGFGDGTSWNDSENWSLGANPGSTTEVIFSDPPFGTTHVIGDQVIGSITFQGTLNTPTEIGLGLAPGTLQVNGNITNLNSATHVISAPLIAGADSTWQGPLSVTNNLDIGIHQVGILNMVNISGANLNFNITSSTIYGQFIGLGSLNVNGSILNFFGDYSGNEGDVFTFATSGFVGADPVIGQLPTLSDGLTWNTSQLISDGVLTVVPEPSSCVIFIIFFSSLFLARRRR